MKERIIAVQGGAIDEYAYIVEEYQQQIYIFCCRLLSNEQEAEDAVQEILFKGYSGLHNYTHIVSFNAWLYKIAYNHCISLLRKRKLQSKMLWWAKDDMVTESTEDSVVKHVFSEPITRVLTGLSPYERSLLILHVFQEKTFNEIGEIVGKSPEAVRKKISRIKDRLKQLLIQLEEEEAWETQPTWM